MTQAKARITLTEDAAPADRLVRAAASPIEITDALGRKISLRKPTPPANLDFAKAAGSAGLNQVYLAEVLHLKFVFKIDDDVCAVPASDCELRALYQRLGDEGNEAVQLAVFENFMPTGALEGEIKNC